MIYHLFLKNICNSFKNANYCIKNNYIFKNIKIKININRDKIGEKKVEIKKCL